MIIYLIIMSFLFIAYIFQDLTAKTIRTDNSIKYQQGSVSSVLFLIEGIIIVLLIGMRGYTGTDTPNYAIYYALGTYPIDTEPYYINVSNFFHSLGVSFENFELIWATLTMIPIYVVVRHLSKNYVFSMLVLYLLTIPFYAFNIARQMFAVSILTLIMLLVIQILEKKLLNISGILNLVGILLLCNLALGIHKSSKIGLFLIFVTVLLYFVLNRWPKFLTMIGLISIVISVVTYFSPELTAHIVFNLVQLEGTDYSSYVSLGQTKSYNSSVLTLTLTILRVLVLFTPYVRRYHRQNIINKFLIAAYAMSTMLQSIQASWISDRIAIFFVVIPVILFPNMIFEPIVQKPKGMFAQLYFPTLIFLILFITFFRTVLQNFNGIIPYGV